MLNTLWTRVKTVCGSCFSNSVIEAPSQMAPVSGIKFKVAKHDARPVIRVGYTPRNAEGVLKSVWDPPSAMTSDRASTKCKGGLIVCLLAKSDESLTRSRAFPVILRKRCFIVNLIYTTKKWICVHSPTGLQPTPRTHNQACCLPLIRDVISH